MVVHGAVQYTEAVFTKNAEFAPEKEYRFAILGWGPPLQNHVVMPLTSQLLDCYGPSVAVSDLELAQKRK